MTTAAVQAYLDTLTDEQRSVIDPIRATILAHLPEGYEEGLYYGALGYHVPHSICPDGYHCDASQPVPFAGLSAKKKKFKLDLFCLYVDKEAKERFVTAWKATGNKLDMGAGCVRFSKLEAVPLDVVGETIASLPVEHFLERYEAIVPKAAAKKRSYNKG